MKNLKNKIVNIKGITLISLIITIIVLLILAGITISQLSNSGLFDKSKQAKEKYQNAQEDEEDKIAKYSNEIDGYVNGNRGTVSISEEEYNRLLRASNSNYYLTNEQIVGTWIDGKPLYQKAFTTTSPSTASNGTYAYSAFNHNISNIKEIIQSSGTITSNSFHSTLPFFTDGGNKVKYNISNTEISIASDSTYANGKSIYITLQYTKTTD